MESNGNQKALLEHLSNNFHGFKGFGGVQERPDSIISAQTQTTPTHPSRPSEWRTANRDGRVGECSTGVWGNCFLKPALNVLGTRDQEKRTSWKSEERQAPTYLRWV